MTNGFYWVYQAAWDPAARLEWMDANGFAAQVLYPNAIGIGGQTMAKGGAGPGLRRLCVEMYNDAMAELQASSDYRFIPMPVLPAWDIAECAREAERLAGLGFR